MTWADMTWPDESRWGGANPQRESESDLWQRTHQVRRASPQAWVTAGAAVTDTPVRPEGQAWPVLRATDCPPDVPVGPCPVSPDRTGLPVTVRDFTPGHPSGEALH
ncbi:hypothetical protein LAJ19_06840 [Deinococcus taeanensis]|uniref:hypothetical protein n=1 Tax=Deinococcus taeanensis TaxID=2737050 RepID=UPI001CDD7F26|nr:hypothetical protein [Deinococcus taeanensis]UBV43923.1 hypothetical protein LAJ19_06840 [Deinococcus taeanensis]